MIPINAQIEMFPEFTPEEEEAMKALAEHMGKLADAAEGKAPSALDKQVSGDHYKKLKIQPMEYSFHNKLDPCQHTAIKYITRFRDKAGRADLEKAIHCIELLIELEYGNGTDTRSEG